MSRRAGCKEGVSVSLPQRATRVETGGVIVSSLK